MTYLRRTSSGLKLSVAIAAGLLGGWTALAMSLAPTDPVVDRIESAANATVWRSHKAVQADLVAEFGGNKMFDGVITFTTDGGRSRLAWKSGVVAVFDGKTAWTTSQDVPLPRFQVLTWPYFFSVPYKLRDGGVTIRPTDPKPATPGQALVPTWQMSFAPGTGDANDLYYLFPDPVTGRLTSMAYTVSYGKTQAEASKQLFAAVYSDYKTVDGVTLPHHITFHTYDPTTGIDPAERGQATLSNVRFVTPPADTFTQPQGATEAVVATATPATQPASK